MYGGDDGLIEVGLECLFDLMAEVEKADGQRDDGEQLVGQADRDEEEQQEIEGTRSLVSTGVGSGHDS